MRTRGQLRWTRLAICAAALFATSCRQTAEDAPAEDNRTNTVTQPSPLPVVEAPMDRATLLGRVAAAASAAALRQDDIAAQRELDGRSVEIRIRFGCTGDVNAPKAFSVAFDEQDRTLRLRAAPNLTRDDPAVAAIAGDTIEAVEGFWIPRPWLLADGCPVLPSPSRVAPADAEAASQSDGTEGAPSPDPAPAAAQRIGIARFYAATDSRTGRRDGRAYSALSVLPANQQPSPEGYNLVLAGRLRQVPGGRVIVCRVAGANAPPDCVVSADIDHVWVEHPRTRGVLANWGG